MTCMLHMAHICGPSLQEFRWGKLDLSCHRPRESTIMSRPAVFYAMIGCVTVTVTVVSLGFFFWDKGLEVLISK